MAYQSYFDIKQPTYDPAPSSEQKKKAAPKPKPKEKPKKGLVGQIYHNLTHNLVTDATGGLAKGAINTAKAPVNLTRTAVAEVTNNEKAADSAARQTKDAYDNSIAAGIVNSTAKPIIEKSKKQIKHLSGRTSTQAERSKIIKNQEAAKDNEYKTATRGLKGDPGAAATIEAESMATKGRKAPEIRAYLDKAVRKMDENERRAAGTAASTASLAVGAGSLNTLSRAEIAKRIVPTATAGFVGSEGAVLAENPNATQEELGQAGITGLIAGAVLPVAAYGVNKVNPFVKPRNVAPEVTSTFNEASRRADTASNAGKTAVSKPIFEQTPKTTKIPVQDAVEAPRVDLPDSIKIDNKTTLYHGTTKENAKSLIDNGYNPELNTKGYAESPYALFTSKFKDNKSDHSAGTYGDGTIVNVTPKSDAVLLNANSKTWLDTMGTSRGAKESAEWAAELKKRGYDGIEEVNGEVTVLNPEKFDITDGKPKKYTPFAEAQKQQNNKAFGTEDKYVYHADSTNAPVENFAKNGIKPSTQGQSGEGVYLANTIDNTEYNYSTKMGDKATIYRVDKDALIQKYGKYPENKDGVQFDESTGEILLDGKRNIPPEFLEVKKGDKWVKLKEDVKPTEAPTKAPEAKQLVTKVDKHNKTIDKLLDDEGLAIKEYRAISDNPPQGVSSNSPEFIQYESKLDAARVKLDNVRSEQIKLNSAVRDDLNGYFTEKGVDAKKVADIIDKWSWGFSKTKDFIDSSGLNAKEVAAMKALSQEFYDEPVTAYRGVWSNTDDLFDKDGNISTKSNVATSVSESKKAAKAFAKGRGANNAKEIKQSAVITEKVNPEDIIVSYKWAGAYNGLIQSEKELIIDNVAGKKYLSDNIEPVKGSTKTTPTETKPVKTPDTPKPEGKAASRVYQRLKAENPELKDDVSYEAIQLKKDAEKAVDLIAKDKQEAFDIAMGARTSPDVTSTATNIALAQKALQEGDDALYNRLVVNRSLAQTRRGQELVAEKGSITDNSTDRYVKELIASRLDHVGKKYLAGIEIGKKKSSAARATKVIDDEVVKLEKKVKARKLDTKTALALLDQMECL